MLERIFYWIDQTPGCETGTGLQRVTRCLSRALEDLRKELIYLQWSTKHHAPVRTPDDELRKFARWGGPVFRPKGAKGIPLHEEEGGRARLWRNWLVVPEVPYTSRRGSHLTFALVDYARRNGLRIAFILYDLIPIVLPGYEDRRLPHGRYAELLTLADVVVPISRYSAREFERYCGAVLKLPPSQMPLVAPVLLADEFAGHPRVDTVVEPVGGPVRIASLGRIEPRKNQLKLLEAFNAFCSENPRVDVRLTVIGGLHPALKFEVERLVAENSKIELISFLGEEAVVERLATSHFSVFPSLEEGYGLPIAESLWLGKPCVCANFGSMAEVADGGGCLTVDTRSVDEIKQALGALVLDGSLRRTLAQEAVTRRPRRWRDYASDLWTALEQCEERRRIFYGFDDVVDRRSILRRSARTVRFTIGRIAGAATSAVLPEVSPSIDSVVRRVPAVRRRLHPRVAFISPYPPDATGAADYIACLLPEVSRFAEVELFTDAARPVCQHGIRFAGPVSAFPRLRGTYDATVPVIGDLQFHRQIAKLVGELGGICIIYDSSFAALARRPHARSGFRKLGNEYPRLNLSRERANEPLDGPPRFGSLFFDGIVYAAQRLIVHSRELQARVNALYGVDAEYLPLCPHLEFEDEELSKGNRTLTRERLGIGREQIVIATFGAIRPQKAPADCIMALMGLRKLHGNAHLYFVGPPCHPMGSLRELVRENGLEPFVHFTNARVSPEIYRDYLIAADAGVQLRTDGPVALSHALMDTIAAGLPTVANAGPATWIEAPSYVYRVPDNADAADIAERLAHLLADRHDRLQTTDDRNEYRKARSFASYADGLRQILGFA